MCLNMDKKNKCCHLHGRAKLGLMRQVFISLLLLVFTKPIFALPNDREQIVQLRAGSADINQQTHTGIYLIDVQLDQGTTHIRAVEAITTANEKNQLILAEIKGNKTIQAHYWSLPEVNKPLMHAYADIIKYHPESHLIELIGNARVDQENNSFSAPKITYDTLAQHVVSESSSTARTTIIFHPEKHA